MSMMGSMISMISLKFLWFFLSKILHTGNQMMTTNMKFYTNKLGGEVTEMKLLTDLIAENDLDLVSNQY